MKTSLVITTYNWKEALKPVLESVLTQDELPDEVIIADDGSREDTKELIESFQKTFPVKLIHSWIPDEGFQLSKSRNKAIAQASGDYIIMIDGDMVLSPSFIKSHKAVAKKDQFVQGGRVLTDLEASQKIMAGNLVPSFFTAGIKNRHNSIYSPVMSQLFSKIKNNINSTRGCNMAFWKSDVVDVNGFNEDFTGWGREDSEFVVRLLNRNKNRLYLKFAGIGYHLYHDEKSRDSLNTNDKILDAAIANKSVRCSNGIDKYLANN